MRFAVLATSLLFAACAPLTQQQLDANEHGDAEWQNRYLAYNQLCADAGGRIVTLSTSANHLRRTGFPRRGDYYSCTQCVGELPRD